MAMGAITCIGTNSFPTFVYIDRHLNSYIWEKMIDITNEKFPTPTAVAYITPRKEAPIVFNGYPLFPLYHTETTHYNDKIVLKVETALRTKDYDNDEYFIRPITYVGEYLPKPGENIKKSTAYDEFEGVALGIFNQVVMNELFMYRGERMAYDFRDSWPTIVEEKRREWVIKKYSK